MKNEFILLLLLVLIFWSSNFLFAAGSSPPLTSKAKVSMPTEIFYKIVYWPGRTAPSGRVDFNLGQTGEPSPGQTSWPDSDSWTSLAANVGFSIVCSAPPGDHTLKISCGKLHNVTEPSSFTYSIPYESADGTTKYFGFSLKKDGKYIVGGDKDMRAYSETPYEDHWASTDIGHEYSLYNMLYIPPTAAPGEYKATGTPPYGDLTIEFE